MGTYSTQPLKHLILNGSWGGSIPPIGTNYSIDMQDFQTDNGRLLIKKDALIENGIYTEVSYRNQKSKGRFQEIVFDNNKVVILGSLPEQTRKKVLDKYSQLTSEYTQLMLASQAVGVDCSKMAVEFTADALQINEPFIRSSIESYVFANYSAYTWAYLEAGLHSDSVKGYSKQCALVQWIGDFVQQIHTSEPDTKRAALLLRSFRANLLTALSGMQFEIKIPSNETRFNQWFDAIISKLQAGEKPESIITIKRIGNSNSGKITDEQLKIVLYWHKNGTNMSVANLYKKWIVWGEQAGWWRDADGNYNPPTEGRLYQLLQPLKNPMTLSKTDNINYLLNCLPTATRDLPTHKNHVWVIDGTAHNENVSAKGKVRQHVYSIKVADVATLRLVGVSSLIGVREPWDALKDAILMGIKETGHKPAIIHCDHGPSWKELENWCNANDIKLYPSITGNARAKTIESLFNMFDNDITRFLRGYSGQNRTATGSINSKPGEKRETLGKQHARSAVIAMEWARTEGVKAWNERVIETLERKPCNKTPFEMWEEKASYTPKLSYTSLCQLCGTRHDRKLTIEGIDIQHNNESYLYFPAIKTPEQQAMANRIFTTIPLDKHNDNALSIYILDGGEPAPVFTKDGKYLGVWSLKKNISFTAAFDDDWAQKKRLKNMTSLREGITTIAKNLSNEIDNYVERHPEFERIETLGNEMLTGKRRAYTGRYDKTALLEEEIDAKDIQIPAQVQYKELIDPDTGEILRVKLID